MEARSELTAQDLRAVMRAYGVALRAHQQVVNALNVYPVPDGDTGTNMMLTVDSVVAELDALGPDPALAEVCAALSHGSLMGARGNSGVILSQLMRGLAQTLSACDGGGVAGPTVLSAALGRAAELAFQAVVRPVEGTILTVARAAGEGAAEAAAGPAASLSSVIERARHTASEALARTPEMLEALARAGVVDAGGTGYLLMLDALLHVVDGRPLPSPPGLPVLRDLPGALESRSGPSDGPSGHDRRAMAGPRYEVMYLLDARDDAIFDFKEVWAGIGDSIVVVGGEGLWNCHIHTDDIGAAVEAALDAGRPRNIRVTDLDEQVEEVRWVREGADGAGPTAETLSGPPPVTGVVAVVSGEGVGRIFRSLGVHHQVLGGQSMNPSTAELLEAVEAVDSDAVVILPNNKNIRPVAEQVDLLTKKAVRVVPTASIVEGFAALLAYDPAAEIAENEQAMEASARRVVAGEVTCAVRDAATEVGPVHEGEWIGLARDKIVSVGGTVTAAAIGLLEHVVGDDHELVTLIEGEGATPADTRRITEWMNEAHPDVAVEVHLGGQPLYPYLLGIE